ncbi:MAG: HAD-IC family P-type ATPase [Devosia sp.]|nr:HAD-IC family P-type ATPase [Devosia sp.]
MRPLPQLHRQAFAEPDPTRPVLAGATPEAVMAGLAATAAGLSTEEAQRRQRRFGLNQFADTRQALPLTVLFNQFRSPFVLILLAAAALSAGLGETDQSVIIVAIVLASSLLGFFQEYRAANTVRALRSRLTTLSRVWRNGAAADLPVAELVPGDVVDLTAGSMIAADGFLVEVTSLHVDESPLTGESFPAAKDAAIAGEPLAAGQLVHMGTSVRSGTGRMVVAATGAGTQYARIAISARGLEAETSFARGVRRFGLMMTQVMVVIVLVVFPVNLLLHRPLFDSLLFAAALAVGLTPELLPAIVTVTLARGARRLAAAGVLVKRLVAIENLGAMDVLCTDKTGTLTEGRLEVHQAAGIGATDGTVAARWAWLNARFQTGLPNPLDEAILAGVAPAVADYRKLGEVPYDFERKRLSVLLSGPEGTVLVCKGAVSEVLAQSSGYLDGAAVAEITPDQRKQQERRLREWSAKGLRVIAVAIRTMRSDAAPTLADEAGLTLVGYLLFADPVKQGVAETIAALKARGVALKIITGDNRYVAAEVAAAVGLSTRSVLTGAELDRLNRRQLAQRIAHCEVFAEVTPDQKERLIEAFRRSGKVVGYLGDGINDAPALRAADLGISVDTAVSSLFDGVTFGVLLLLFGDNPAAVQTGWFVESLLTELAIIYVMRTRKPFFASPPGLWLVAISIGVAVVGIGLPYLPLGGATGFVALPPAAMTLLVLIAIAYAGASELLKHWPAVQTRSRAISTTGRTSS